MLQYILDHMIVYLNDATGTIQAPADMPKEFTGQNKVSDFRSKHYKYVCDAIMLWAHNRFYTERPVSTIINDGLLNEICGRLQLFVEFRMAYIGPTFNIEENDSMRLVEDCPDDFPNLYYECFSNHWEAPNIRGNENYRRGNSNSNYRSHSAKNFDPNQIPT